MNDQTPEKKLAYRLYNDEVKPKTNLKNLIESGRGFFEYIKGDERNLFLAFVVVLLNSIAGVLTPYIIGLAIDKYIGQGNIAGLKTLLFGLGGVYLLTVFAGYFQGMLMGGVAQRTLFRLRSALFNKLQELPIAFFNQNKTGDLMSRLNNDTDKLNQFLSESIMRFVGNFFVLFGIAVFVFFLNWKLALVMLSMTALLVVITELLSPWIERQNKKNLDATGLLSASLQENLSNFRVIVASSKREYFRNNLETANAATFKTAFRSDAANRVFEPIYDFAGSTALILVLWYGFHLIGQGAMTIGLLVAFVSYTQKFYDPLRILATIFGTIQLSVAAWSRVRAVFLMKTNLTVIEDTSPKNPTKPLRLELKDVSFGYTEGLMVIENASLSFEAGKTYALVGPTGGGKSTLANLMARLYDPLSGEIYLNGKNIKSFEAFERASLVSVILQDPILFTGTVADNIRYGNFKLADLSDEGLEKVLTEKGFADVFARFPEGLGTKLSQASGAGLSIGQKQLISFMRAVLREPALLILDEATANIDTVTEVILNKTLEALPKDTTKVIIAHRLNTIKEADEIMFVNGHHVTRAGDFHEAIRLIEHSKRAS